MKIKLYDVQYDKVIKSYYLTTLFGIAHSEGIVGHAVFLADYNE